MQKWTVYCAESRVGGIPVPQLPGANSLVNGERGNNHYFTGDGPDVDTLPLRSTAVGEIFDNRNWTAAGHLLSRILTRGPAQQEDIFDHLAHDHSQQAKHPLRLLISSNWVK